MAHLTALFITLGLCVVLACALIGWGRALQRAWPGPDGAANGVFLELWLGWAVFVGMLQFIHLFAPLVAWTVIPLLVPGLVFCARAGPVASVRPRFRLDLATLLAVGIWLIAAWWIFSRAMQTPLEFDGGLYHFQAIRWINEERIMPGLGNLHGRLAFNSAFYPFVAALNFSPLFGHGRSIANAFLGLVLLAQILSRLHGAFTRPAAFTGRDGLAPLANLAALPLVGYICLTTLGLASPSADLASAFVQLAIFLLLVDAFDCECAGQANQESRVATLVLLSINAVTLKLSNLGFAAGVIALCLAAGWRARIVAEHSRAAVRTTIAVGGVLSAIWLVRGYVLSGYPCYPSTLGGIAFDWTVPVEQAQRDAAAIYSWARQPWAEAKDVLGNSRWLGPWFYRAGRNIEGIVAPVGVALVAVLSALAIQFRPRGRPAPVGYAAWWLMVPVGTGLIFWWITAPDPRFANALLWLLPIAALIALAANVRARLVFRPSASVVVVLIVLCNAHFALWVVRHPESLRDISWVGWQPVLPPGFTPRATASGLRVNTYRYDPVELIWDGPRPATPDFNPRLRLRVPDKPEFGYTTR